MTPPRTIGTGFSFMRRDVFSGFARRDHPTHPDATSEGLANGIVTGFVEA